MKSNDQLGLDVIYTRSLVQKVPLTEDVINNLDETGIKAPNIWVFWADGGLTLPDFDKVYSQLYNDTDTDSFPQTPSPDIYFSVTELLGSAQYVSKTWPDGQNVLNCEYGNTKFKQSQPLSASVPDWRQQLPGPKKYGQSGTVLQLPKTVRIICVDLATTNTECAAGTRQYWTYYYLAPGQSLYDASGNIIATAPTLGPPPYSAGEVIPSGIYVSVELPISGGASISVFYVNMRESSGGHFLTIETTILTFEYNLGDPSLGLSPHSHPGPTLTFPVGIFDNSVVTTFPSRQTYENHIKRHISFDYRYLVLANELQEEFHDLNIQFVCLTPDGIVKYIYYPYLSSLNTLSSFYGSQIKQSRPQFINDPRYWNFGPSATLGQYASFSATAPGIAGHFLKALMPVTIPAQYHDPQYGDRRQIQGVLNGDVLNLVFVRQSVADLSYTLPDSGIVPNTGTSLGFNMYLPYWELYTKSGTTYNLQASLSETVFMQSGMRIWDIEAAQVKIATAGITCQTVFFTDLSIVDQVTNGPVQDPAIPPVNTPIGSVTAQKLRQCVEQTDPELRWNYGGEVDSETFNIADLASTIRKHFPP